MTGSSILACPDDLVGARDVSQPVLTQSTRAWPSRSCDTGIVGAGDPEDFQRVGHGWLALLLGDDRPLGWPGGSATGPGPARRFALTRIGRGAKPRRHPRRNRGVHARLGRLDKGVSADERSRTSRWPCRPST